MKEQCMICGSMVEDVSGICPVCGSVLGRSTQVNSTNVNMGGMPGQPSGTMNGGQSVYQNQSMGYGQPAYNYQNPNGMMQPEGKKKVLFSVLSIVSAVLGILTVCFPVVSLIFCVAAIVFGIIALVKKQIKVPAILGLVFAGIATLISISVLCFNLIMTSVVGTDIMGIFQQSFDVFEEGCTELEDVMLENPDAVGTEYIILYSDGSYETANDYGYYECLSYADEATRSYMEYETLFAMSEHYEIKNVTCINLYSYGSSEYYSFVVPEDYMPGDMIYYIERVGYGETDFELTPVYTIPLSEANY